MTPTDANSTPTPRRRRRLWGLLAGTVGTLALGVLTFNVWVTSVVNGALGTTAIDATLAHVRLDVGQGQFTIVGLSWQSTDGNTRMTLDSLACAIPVWRSGVWHLASAHAGSLHVEVNGAKPGEEDAPPFWEGLATGLHIDSMAWQHVTVSANRSHTAHLTGSQLCQLTLDKTGLRWEDLRLGGGRVVSPALPDTLELPPGQCAASWRPSGLELHSEGLSLPGLAFEGDLSWPMNDGGGRLHFDWPVLHPWLEAAGMGARVKDFGLATAQSEMTWSTQGPRWELSAAGPSWLSCQASGSDSSWVGHLDLSAIPPVARDFWPSDVCRIDLEGDVRESRLAVAGDSSVSAQIRIRPPHSWQTWLTSRNTWPHLEVELDRWGNLISSPEERLTASVHPDGDACAVSLAQLTSSFPWSAAGRYTENRWDIRAEAGPTILGVDTLAFSSEAQVDLREDGLRWQALNRALAWKDTLMWTGDVNWNESEISWMSSLHGMDAHLDARGEDLPWTVAEAAMAWLHRRPASWPALKCSGQIGPNQPLLALTMPDLSLQDTASFHVSCGGDVAQLSLNVPRGRVSNVGLGPSNLSLSSSANHVQGHLSMRAAFGDKPWNAHVDLQGTDRWQALTEVTLPDGQVASLRTDAHPDETSWTWGLLEISIPLGTQRLALQNGPIHWNSEDDNTAGPHVLLGGSLGSVALNVLPSSHGAWTVDVEGQLTSGGLSSLHHALHADGLEFQGQWSHDGASGAVGTLQTASHNVAFESLSFASLTSRMHFREGRWHAEVNADQPTSQTHLHGTATWEVSTPDDLRVDAKVTHIPLSWVQPWVDSSAAILTGTLDAAVEMSGPWRAPLLSGGGIIDTLTAEIPSLGTSFGASGAFVIGRDEVVLRSCVLSDRLGATARVEGALLHDGFADWNFDVSMVDTPKDMLIMDLPPSSNSPVSGVLVGRGSLDAFFWNNRLELRGDVSAEAPTDFTLSLEDGESEGWGSWVVFATDAPSDTVAAPEEVDKLSVLLDLNIEAKPEAQVTILTDPENNANLVGSTEGNIHLTLEDWERMTLTGNLTVVEGRYDFALGPLLRKQFSVDAGGTLFWSGDPYQGTVDLHAKYATRANVQPLLGSASTGVQNEDIDVVLHLNGPMLRPNIGFDLDAPRAPSIVAEALATAVLDDAERTRQAIALLSLQEFLPQQINTLELGTTGLQEYSIDMVTSQLSNWLSKINEDIDVGIRYDASSALNPASVNQDALQLALKASFFQDKLEVEGALGSRDMTQEALSEAQLQNVRILYNLNEERGLQLTGFSESQSTVTQSGNTTSQGVGIRWHRSFNWTWPWNQSKTASEDN